MVVFCNDDVFVVLRRTGDLVQQSMYISVRPIFGLFRNPLKIPLQIKLQSINIFYAKHHIMNAVGILRSANR